MANTTKVYLLNVPLENDYKHTLYFNSLASQQAYFESRIVKSYTDFSYQRKDHIIRVPAHFDTLQNINYVMYQNTAYSNKWFYAFVTNIKYIDDGRTELTIETDYLQTWYFDITVKPSFIEREHVSDDTIGANTVPENLEMGEYVCNAHHEISQLKTLQIVWGTTYDITNQVNIKGGNYHGIYSGIRYYSLPVSMASGVSDVLSLFDEGHADAIQCIFLAPEFITHDSNNNVASIDNSNSPQSFIYTLNKTNALNGYTPKNNKLKTFPYNYLLASNNNGANAIYQMEHFTDPQNEGQIYFNIFGALCPGCSIRLIPLYYKGANSNDEEGLNLGKYPICNWNSDVYTNWLTQNSVNIGLSIAGDVGQIIGGTAVAVASGGIGTAVGGASIVSGVSGVANTLAQIHQQSFTPPQSKGNINCGDIITASSKNTFHFYNMSIKYEYARIIDGFFDMFGYKVSRVKQPNTHHRSRYWYTKTIDVNIDGAIPNQDMQIIKNAYNNGITFWRNAEEIQNYSLSNGIANVV